MNIRPDDFQYAMENTRVIRAPDQQIATFGQTTFRYFLLTELMDEVDSIRLRNGLIHAERPQILTMENHRRLLIDGFGEHAREFAEWLDSQPENLSFLRYGFSFKQTDFKEQILSMSIDDALGYVSALADKNEDPLDAIIHGVDEGWEVCILKFTADLIRKSAGGNLDDFRKRGLL